MKLFKLPTQVYKFNEFSEFASAFQLGAGDLVLTHEFIYRPFMRPLDLKADFIMQEQYGTGEPNDIMINRLMSDLVGKSYKRVVAVGGGTVIDIAKLLVFETLGDTVAMFEKRSPLVKDKGLIIVPTTCGTGSEVTNIAIAELTTKQTKMGLAVDEMYPEYAVLIPELLNGLPYPFFVYSSIDALIHAIESYVSPNANSYTQMYSLMAAKMILNGYQAIVEKGEFHRFEIMEDFVVGSNYAGIAFGNAGVGAVHAMSYPLGGTYHVPHGEANYQFFTEVFKTYYQLKPDGAMAELTAFLAEVLAVKPEQVFEGIEQLLGKLLARKPLRAYGMTANEVELFADSVIEKQQRLLGNNYVPLSRTMIRDIYQALY